MEAEENDAGGIRTIAGLRFYKPIHVIGNHTWPSHTLFQK